MTGLEARDLNEISGGRFVLGVGTGNLRFNDLYMGIDSSKAKARCGISWKSWGWWSAGGLQSGCAIRVMYTASAGGPLMEPNNANTACLHVCLGPNMVRLAGAVSDGVGIGIMSSVEFVQDIVRPNARLGAEQAGRDPDALLFPTAATVAQQGRRGSAYGQQACHLQALSPDTAPLLRLTAAATGL